MEILGTLKNADDSGWEGVVANFWKLSLGTLAANFAAIEVLVEKIILNLMLLMELLHATVGWAEFFSFLFLEIQKHLGLGPGLKSCQ